jgi:hypothetical protein
MAGLVGAQLTGINGKQALSFPVQRVPLFRG